jgi:hypothetical protein
LNDLEVLKEMHDSHWSQASPSDLRFEQLMVLAKILAQVVLPTPLGPQKRYACARWLFRMALFRVFVMESCPTTMLNDGGRYFLAETMKFSILPESCLLNLICSLTNIVKNQY